MHYVNGFFKYVYDFGFWLAKIMVLQIYWVLFTVLGLGIFGIAPATVAVSTIIHGWFTEKKNVALFKEFIAIYRRSFKKSNLLFWGWAFIGLFLYFDYFVSKTYIQSFYFHIVIMLVIVITLGSFAHFLTVFVRYDLPLLQYFKQSFLIALARPMESIAIFVALLLLYYVYMFLPVLAVFIGVPLTLYPVLWFSYRACIAVEDSKEKIEQQSKTPSYGRS
ncbi:YesL family protein [Gracilibacillus marinus]|uniref:YesL family protein n=1 Tax=Gracilibacillus marinus TaxID=630535 RepID=A0ABV8VV18_9BACI